MTFEQDPFGTKVNPFSGSFRNILNEIANYVGELAKYLPDMPALRLLAREERGVIRYRMFPAILLNAEQKGVNRWKYAWVEYIPSHLENPVPRVDQSLGVFCRRSDTRGNIDLGTEEEPIPETGEEFGLFALNGAEMFNTADDDEYQSFGVLPEETAEHTTTLLPIGAFGEENDDEDDISRQCMVMMYEFPATDAKNDDCRYFFFAANSLKVECA
jgi:hypothetical protein